MPSRARLLQVPRWQTTRPHPASEFVVDRKGRIAYEDLAYSPRASVSFGKLQGALKTLAAAQP